jgi:hypothetical protein
MFGTLTQARPAAAAGGGVTDHGLLTGLLDHDHTQYPLLAGLAGGQTLIGGLAASQHLTLQSTADATRGYVRAQDDLQLLSNIIRDSAGANRLRLAAATPHLLLTGDPRINGWMAINSDPFVGGQLRIAPVLTVGAPTYQMLSVAPSGVIDSDLFALNLSATPAVGSGVTVPEYKGTLSMLIPAVTGTISDLAAMEGSLGTFAGAAPGAITLAHHFSASTWGLGWYTRKPTTLALFDAAQDCGNAAIPTVYGLRIVNQSGITVRLLELGPATPYLRLEGGAAPAGVNSKLIANFGGTLYRLTRNAVTGAVETAAP